MVNPSMYYVPPHREPEPEPPAKEPSASGPSSLPPSEVPRRKPSPAGPPRSNSFQGSLRLGRFFGTDVYVHWTWFLAAYWLISSRPNVYSSMAWNVAEYVAGFLIVTLHEFGHVLACRSVGGRADRVLLWPMGGLAFVWTPPRPGASLWTTVAGPLVNVFLAPIFFVAAFASMPDPDVPPSDVFLLLSGLTWFNVIVLVFNLLPIFPLDGGRIVQAALWYAVGQAKSLAISGYVGMAAGIAGGLFALSAGEVWLAAMAGFLVLGAYGATVQAKRLAVLESIPRREEIRCPHCGESPPAGPFWLCPRCNGASDLFAPEHCPAGGDHAPLGICPNCGQPVAAGEWLARSGG